MDPVTRASTAGSAPVLPFPDLPSIALMPLTYTSTAPITRPHASTTAGIKRPAPPSRPSSVRIKRLSSTQRITPHVSIQEPSMDHGAITEEEESSGRRRSSSAPLQPFGRSRGTSDGSSRRPHRLSHMARLDEVNTASARPNLQSRPSWFNRRFPSQAATTTLGLQSEHKKEQDSGRLQKAKSLEYTAGIVDLLDVVDPEVSTLSTLNNVQNSLFVPDLGRFLNRRPMYELTARDAGLPTDNRKTVGSLNKRPRAGTITEEDEALGLDHVLNQAARRSSGGEGASLHTITSRLSDSHFAVLPHGIVLDDWSELDKAELNDHVRHLLHSRREKFKRGWKGFKKYVSKPLGFCVTLYAFLITIFGLLWVLFLIGWISGGDYDRHRYLINVIDNVLVALFAIVGDGLAPFRCVDTYHMIFIAHYARLEWRLRKRAKLPKLPNPNDLPTETAASTDLERCVDIVQHVSSSSSSAEKPLPHTSSSTTSATSSTTAEPSLALSPLQQRRLAHHQAKFSKSHTFYKPHETATHQAFSIRLLIAIVALLDGHSAFQIALGACTWGINYKVRPGALTTVLLVCSITCNTTAGFLISVGDKRSRKKDVLERMFRQALTEQALGKMKERRGIVPVKVAAVHDDDEGDDGGDLAAGGGGGGADGGTRGRASSTKATTTTTTTVSGGTKYLHDGKEEEETTEEEEQHVRNEVRREHGGQPRDFAVLAAGVA